MTPEHSHKNSSDVSTYVCFYADTDQMYNIQLPTQQFLAPIRALNKSVQKMVDFGLSKFFLPQNVNGIWVSQGEHLPRHISPTTITTIKTVNGTLQYPKVV